MCDERHVELNVRDTGQGIAPEFLPYIFDRFRQADGTTTRKHGGLGLGLAIVRHLVELHGGTVQAASDGHGQGSTFTLSLPLAASTQAGSNGAPEPAEEGEQKSLVKPAVLEGLRILVVDDEPDTRELIQEVLGRQGAEVRTGGSVADALRTLAEWRADMLISDIGMPFEDGYELIGRVRKLDGGGPRGQIPALALTAYAGAEDSKRALAAGFQTHLAKPVDPQALIAVVARLAGRETAVDA
jgi:CheY-like chemotaxis protein